MSPPHPSPLRAAAWPALLALVATVLWRLPAQWALALAPGGTTCASATGSAWRGGCEGLRVGTRTLQSVTWQLHPLALLRARVAVDVQVDDPLVAGSVRLELGRGGLVLAEQASLRARLDAALVPLLPRGWEGTALADLDTLRLARGHVVAVQGVLRVLDLRQAAPAMAVGSLALRFDGPADAQGRMVGTLADEGGILQVNGTLRLAADGNYSLEGHVAPREGASQALATALQFLGPADAQGRRPFALTGVY